MSSNKQQTFAFALITSLFFLWGFAHNLDPILIPHLKRSFTLTNLQATLVDSAVYVAYFVMAIPAGFITKEFGYKAGIVTGLVTFAIGCYLFIPAANMQSYTFFLIALFIIACGLTLLETTANPYAAILGDPATSTQRLNFAQSFNGLAVALAPTVGARIILTQGLPDSELAKLDETSRRLALAMEASLVKTPYMVLGTVLLLIAFVFLFIKLPSIRQGDEKAESKSIFHALRHKHLAWGVTAQFFYVGAQTCVLSLFILYAASSAGLKQVNAAYYLSLGGLAFLIGRFLGTFLMRYIKGERLLMLYALANILLCLVAIFAKGMITVYAVIGICFFMSIMFPTIFALGIAELKGDTEFGSSLLIMSIVGGAIIPPLFGYIGDATANIQNGYLVPMICFAVIAWFGWKGHRPVSTPLTITQSNPDEISTT